MRTADKQIADILGRLAEIEREAEAVLLAGGCFNTVPDVLRFLRFVRLDSSGCWIWQGGRSGNRYGTFWVRGCQISTHRYAYTAFRGAIPPGAEIDHVCRNKACCNPAHLEPVTHSENEQRKPAYGNQWGTFSRSASA